MLKSALKGLYTSMPCKPLLLGMVRDVVHPSERFYKHLHFTGEFSINIDGRPLRLVHYGCELENAVFWRGLPAGWEPASMDLWIRCCRRSRTIFDVGANTGIYALVARTVSPEAAVYAFEPVARIFRRLERNRDLNGFSITCEELALSNQTGIATIFDPGFEHIYSVTVNRNLQDPETPVKPVEIRTVRFDEYLARIGMDAPVDLLKVDVETHEAEVLEGMGGILGRDRPAMLIEIISSEVAERVESIVAPLGYVFYNVDERSGPVRRSRLELTDSHNWFLCRESTAKELGLA